MMLDPFSRTVDEPVIEPAQKIQGRVAGLFKADNEGFVTYQVGALPLTFEGIPGDLHSGHTRRSGGREPWYARGTEMRNERQVSILSPAELRIIAGRLVIPELRAEWVGGNMLLEGIPNLTMLPPRSLLFFEGGVTIKVDGDNAPCRASGRSIARHFPQRNDIELAFSRQARNLRGLVGWVEKEGTISSGESFEVRIPPQWIYRA